MAHAETFHGYAPDLGYEFLRSAMAKNDYEARGCEIHADEIFISDGAKGDSGNIQEIFDQNNKIAVCDPVYPVYVDTNVMAGRTGTYDPKSEVWSDVIYMPCTAENQFVPELPKEVPDLIYLCFPNNPTGSAITKDQLQEWVDYANKNGSVIIYDAAYEAYISEDNVPHTIYECEGARTCAIELRSFSKNAGFTGVRLGANRHSKGSQMRRCHAALPLGKTPRNQIQWSTVHHSESRRGRVFRSGKSTAERTDRLLMRNAKTIYDGPQRSRIHRIRRSEFSVSLAEDAGSHDVLGIL